MIESSSTQNKEEEQEQNEEYKTNKFLAFYKKQQNIFLNVDAKESDIASLYQSILQKEYIDLRSDLESSVAIHVLLKTEKNKMEQTFLKNAIQGLQLFQKNRDLLSAGFGNHLFSQMKVEYHQKFSPVFHFGDFGYKYYIVLKGSVDLLMPRSDCVEENSKLAEANEPQIPYFQRGNFEGLPHESFDQFLERQYPNMSFIKTFQPGEAFGEIALITGQKRTGSIIARENVCFLVITKQAFHEIVGRFHEFLQIQKLEFLSQFFFLQQIPKAKLLSLIQFMKILQYKRNNVLYDEKQFTNGIYFLKEGEVSITTRISAAPSPPSSSQSGKTQLLRLGNKQNNIATKTTIKATNSYFGEEELVLELPQRKSKAVCISETCEIFLFTKDIIITQGKQFNVLNKLKQNYQLKLSWEEERNASIQSVAKQQEERISQFQRAQYNKISLSVSQLDPSILIEQSPQTQKKSFNTEELTPSSLTGTYLSKGKQYKSHSRFSSTHESASYEPGSFSTAVSFINQVSAPGTSISKKSISQNLIPLGGRLSNFISADSPTPSKLKEESENVFSTRNKSEIVKIKPKSMYSLIPETTGTLRGTSNISSKDINNVSIDKVFYDSTHTFFESKLKQSEQAKTEIFAKINSKSRSIQPIPSLVEINKPEFRIRKNSLQYIPQSTQQRFSVQSTFQSNPSAQSSEFNFQSRKNDQNFQKEPQTTGNQANNLSKAQHLIGSAKQIGQGYIQPSSPQSQLRQSTSQPSILKENIKNSAIYDNPQLFKNSNNTPTPIINQSVHLQPLQFSSNHMLPQSTLNQLDTLFEEDDDANSPRKRNLRQNDNDMEQKVQLLEKFQLGKKVAQYIRRKSESEKYVSSNTLHNNQQQFQIFDQVFINSNDSGLSSKIDSPFSLKSKDYILKKDIRKASFDNPNSQDYLSSKKPPKLSFVSPQITVKKNNMQ